MRIGGWIAAIWAVVAWAMLIGTGPLARIAVVCVLLQAAIEYRALARHAALLAGTAVFAAAIAIAAAMLGTPPAAIVEAAGRLVGIVLVAPLAVEHASGFWFCRLIERAHLPRQLSLAVISSFSILPLLLEDVTTLIYHHRQLGGRRGLGVSALTATVVMALDRVQDMEIADCAFDLRTLLASAPGRRPAPGELLYIVQLTIMGLAACRVFLW